MVDWESVRRRRSQGWDWDRIAQDPSVDFHPEPVPDHPGSVLQGIYERRQRDSHGKTPASSPPPSLAPPHQPRWTLARVGYILVPFFGIWCILAYGLASPVGIYVPALPILALGLAIAGFLLAFGLLRTSPRWSGVYRNSVVAGAVSGLLVVAVLGGATALQGAPLLTPVVGNEPAGWVKLPNAPWTENGLPVAFFVGSAACPYCSATSWAVAAALEKFGNLSGLSFATSSPSDAYPDTPEVVLGSSQLDSRWVSWAPLESSDTSVIEVPVPSNIVEHAYMSAYDSGGSVPFIVIGGVYAHTGSLVDPGPLAGYSPATVWGQVQNESGPAWNDIAPAVYFLEAFLWKSDGGQPAALAQNANVAMDLAEIR